MLKIINHTFRLITFMVILISQSIVAEDKAPIIQPGAPGESSKNLDAEAASAIADSSYTKADVKFLQGMIVHHQQAILMSSLAPKRTNNQIILDLALRIDVSQEDEINFMESWLKDRGESVPYHHSMDDMNHMGGMHDMHMHLDMVGMATPKQLEDLRNSKSTDFDRLFLQLMIAHHDGALVMVKDLKGFVGSTYDPVLNEFVADLVNDQGVEIERMNTIAVGLSDDPRAGLAPGLFTADEAILNMELITSLRKPTGFFDPDNPAARGAEDTTAKKDDKENIAKAISASIEIILRAKGNDLYGKDY